MVGPLHWAVLSRAWNRVSVLCARFILCTPEMLRRRQTLWSRWTSTYISSSCWKISESVSPVPKASFFCNSEPRKTALETKLYEADSPWPFLQVKTKSLLAVEKNKLASPVRSVHVVSVTALCLSGLSSAWLHFHLCRGAVLTFIICCFSLFWMWTPYLSIGFFKASLFLEVQGSLRVAMSSTDVAEHWWSLSKWL